MALFRAIARDLLRAGTSVCFEANGQHVAPVSASQLRGDSLVDGDGASAAEATVNEPGELVMRGPQFMLGYWKEPQATAAVLRDGWYWSGDIVTRYSEAFFRVAFVRVHVEDILDRVVRDDLALVDDGDMLC